MSWCDRLASTAGVGFHLSPHFAINDVVSTFAPILDPMVDDFRNPTFTLADHPNGGFNVTTVDGYIYFVDHSRIAVSFQHRMKATAVSGGPPVMEMLSTPKPYTDLLSECSKRLVEATRLLPNIANRKLFQAGVVSTTRVAYDDVPPGILRMVKYQARPWGHEELSSFNMEVTSKVIEEDGWKDRCQHRLIRPEDRKELMSLIFDYHRKFEVAQASSEAQLRTVITKCSQDALAYFEKLAVGDLFDEHIISSETA